MHTWTRDVGLSVLLTGIFLTGSAGWPNLAVAQQPDAEKADEGGGRVPSTLAPDELFDFAVHFIHMGRWEYANQYAAALLATDPDPLAILELTRQPRLRHAFDALTKVAAHDVVGANARAIIHLIKQGEFSERTDPARIREKIKALGEGERASILATDWLGNAGEYAVPYMLEFLASPKEKALHAPIIAALGRLGKSAVNPLVAASRMDDPVVNEFVVQALGAIGYPQAIPYLAAVGAGAGDAGPLAEAANRAIGRIVGAGSAARPTGANAVANAFLALAEKYYYDAGSVRADRQYDSANVWYWTEGEGLERKGVPTEAFNEIMAMRCCELALQHKNDDSEAIALWLAAGARRELALAGQPDATKPGVFASSRFFFNASGARYSHMVLARGLKDRDSSVMLAAIRTLQRIAGAASLIGPEDLKQPLVSALRYPDTAVRNEAALAIANAMPTKGFTDAEVVLPVLVETLGGAGVSGAVLVDANQNRRNAVAGLLQENKFRVAWGSTLAEAVRKANQTLASVDVVVVASSLIIENIDATLGEIQNHPRLLGAPIAILADPSHESNVGRVADSTRGVVAVPANATVEVLAGKIAAAAAEMGRQPLGADDAAAFAARAADVLLLIARGGSPVFDINTVRDGILRVIKDSSDEPLRIRVAEILSLVDFPAGQKAIAAIALGSENTASLRVAMFASLSTAAGRFGNQLDSQQITSLIEAVATETDNDLRTAAARALGALDLSDPRASDLIRAASRDLAGQKAAGAGETQASR